MADDNRFYQLEKPLTRADLTTYAEALSQLQGNILKSHGRAAALHIFLTFREGFHLFAKQFLARLARKWVTSASEQRQHSDFYRAGGRSELFTGLYLSAAGYKYLGLPLDGFSAEFRGGMQKAKLSDPPVSSWEDNYRREIHAMVLVADDRVEDLTRQLGQLQLDLNGKAEIFAELGISIHNAAGQVVEHFGYVDGISQPLFYEADSWIKGFSKDSWDPGAGPNLVLVKDPLTASDHACGTYFVFRKLEQNVRAFHEKVQEMASTLQLGGGGTELAAMIIGRFPDGTPVLDGAPLGRINPANDFNYPTADPEGKRCPFGSHIRKLNPRGDTLASSDNPEEERRHRIARRGITYGLPALTGAPLPETGRGLLFQCCQRDLGKQFEFLQSQWANNDNAPKPCAGKDLLIGQAGDGSLRPLRLSIGSKTAEVAFDSFVTMKGGEYFFAPSIPFLTSLDAPPARAADPASRVYSELRTSGSSSYPGS